jgi:AbrB family looped-hinge helix DNA binding protein
MSELTTLSSKGQIVVPKDMREEMHLDTGTTFAIFGKDDTIILKKVKVPSAKEAFAKVHKWGTKFAKQKGIQEKDVEKIIHKGRGLQSA